MRKYQCFIFESTELEKVRDLAVKSEILKLVEITLVDEKYPYIFIMRASRRGLDRECIAKIEAALARGSISDLEYKRFKREMLEQCIASLEKERVKEVISTLESYIDRLKRASQSI